LKSSRPNSLSKSVELTRRADIVVVGSVHISGEVRQVDETQDIFGDRADLEAGTRLPASGCRATREPCLTPLAGS